MPNFSILLPSASPKSEGGNPFAPDMFDYRSSNTFNFFHSLNTNRRSLLDTLHGCLDDHLDDPAAILGKLPEGKTADLVKLARDVYKAPLMSALDRYAPGIMYKAMDFPGLPTGAQRRLLEEGIIISGLFGLLRPDDLIPTYMLGIDADIPGIGPVADYWRPLITESINETIRDQLVWNVLSEEHERVWDNQLTYSAMVRVKFFRMMNGAMTEVADAVPLLGRLVNFVVRETLEELEPLLLWRHPDGYTYDEERSSYDEASRTHHIAMIRH